MKDILTAMLAAAMPQILQIIGVLVSILATLAVRKLGQLLNLQIEAKHRDTLHRAITTGLMSALSAGMDQRSALTAAVSYARTSSPDAVRQLRAKEPVLLDIANAKLRDLVAPNPNKAE